MMTLHNLERNSLQRKIFMNKLKLEKDAKLKELVWKLDREVWAKVHNPIPVEESWSTSKAREESAKLIEEYFGTIDEVKGVITNLTQCENQIAKNHGKKSFYALMCLTLEPSKQIEIMHEVFELYIQRPQRQ